ncbi:MAG: hypothetical protein OEX01_01240 [Candidatus Bathyarchaeota archaeon]|nr:hypothetical protein [Candidatus Bathyarchaeota archaeon]
MVNISLSIHKSLLSKVQQNVSGKNRSQKICKCVKVGYRIITNTHPDFTTNRQEA